MCSRCSRCCRNNEDEEYPSETESCSEEEWNSDGKSGRGISGSDGAPFFAEMEFAKDRMINRTEKYLIETQKLMKGLPRVIQLCDARKYKEGINFVRISSIWGANPIGHSVPTAPVLAATDKNRVVAAVKWVNEDGLLQIHIKEATLLPQGHLGDAEWVPLPDYQFEGNTLYEYDKDFRKTMLSKDKDYQVLHAVSNMKLDDIMLPHGYVVTGFRLEFKYNDLSVHVQGTKFDFNSGKLILGKEDSTVWLTGDDMKNMPGHPKEYDRARKARYDDWGYPSNEAEENEVITEPNSSIGFTYVNTEDYTDMHHTIPYFDSREVGGRPSIALNGLGVFHRGHRDYGGYLNFRVFNINIADYLDPKHEVIVNEYAK